MSAKLKLLKASPLTWMASRWETTEEQWEFEELASVVKLSVD
jgi:hypothetical protein